MIILVYLISESQSSIIRVYMNRKYIKFGIIALILFIVMGGYLYITKQLNISQSENALWPDYEVREVKIEDSTYNLIVADSPAHWQKGLMHVRKPVSGFDGMIFIFPAYTYQRFWNMNTFENLTLYWMQDDTVVGTSELPSIEESKDIVRVSSPEPVNIVIEIIN